MSNATGITMKWLLVAILGISVCAVSARAEETWTEGDEINTPSISKPAAYNRTYGIGSTVSLSCNDPSDSDDWCDATATPDSGSKADSAVEATWSGGGDGTWSDNEGTSATFVTGTSVGTKTLTVTFDDTDTDQYDDDSTSDSITIEVKNVKMIFKVGETETDTIERGQSGTFEVVDGDGETLDNATYFSWDFNGDDYDASEADHEESSWGGTIVESGTCSVQVTMGVDIVEVSKTITVTNRSGWIMSVNFRPDNEADYGQDDFPGASAILGEYRDAETNTGHIIGPRNPDGTLDDDAYDILEVSGGPNNELWYVSSSSLSVDTESVINMWLKSGKTGYPPAAGSGFYEYNDYRDIDVDGLLTGITNHEGPGSGNGKGHHALAKAEIDSWDINPAQAIEDNVADSESGLQTLCTVEIGDFNGDAKDASDEENIPYGSNFGPAVVYWYQSDTEYWDPIEFADGWTEE